MDLLAALRDKDLDQALKLVLERFACEIGTVHVIEGDGKLHLKAHTKSVPDELLAASRVIPLGKGLAGIAAQSKRPASMSNLFTDSSPRLPEIHDADPAGAICVPMFKGDAVVGTLGVATAKARTFTAEEEALLLDAGRAMAARL